MLPLQYVSIELTVLILAWSWSIFCIFASGYPLEITEAMLANVLKRENLGNIVLVLLYLKTEPTTTKTR